MNKRQYLFTAAIAIAGTAFAGTAAADACQSVYGPWAPATCELHEEGGSALAPGATLSRRIVLPLNTTIDDNELPLYAVEFKTMLGGGSGAGRVRVVMSLSDDQGNHRVPLGDVEATVQEGSDRVSAAVGGHRFPQPAHLNVDIVRIDGGEQALSIKALRITQSFDPDVEGVR